MNSKKWGRLIAAIIFCQLAGVIGSVFTFQAIPTWYATLNKPFFTPPSWIFGPVWVTLYTLMGISFFWIRENKKHKKVFEADALFKIHLVLNALWSFLFFGAKMLLLAYFEIVLMVITLLIVMKKFYKIEKKAAYILIPYLLWITFASILNFTFWKLN